MPVIMLVHMPMLNTFRKLFKYYLKNKTYQDKNTHQVIFAMVGIGYKVQYSDAKQVGTAEWKYQFQQVGIILLYQENGQAA